MKAGVLENVDCFCQIDCFEINDEIEIGRGSQVTVKNDCHSTDDEVAHPGTGQLHQKFFDLADHCASLRQAMSLDSQNAKRASLPARPLVTLQSL